MLSSIRDEMRLVEQVDKLSVRNFDRCISDSSVELTQQQQQRHGALLPSTVRCLIVGPSGCGKTNVLLSLLEDENGLSFENIYLYAKSLHQPKYVYLRNLMSKLPEIGYKEFSEAEDVLPTDEIKPNSVIIFDDVTCSPQSIIRHYFTLGRHFLADIVNISQSYSSIPKQLIRDNANFIVVFRQDQKNLHHIHRDHVGLDMTLTEFANMCSVHCWTSDRYGFLVIDKERSMEDGRYRKGFDCYIKP